MIDSGRHFEPVAVIKRNLDGMAAVKLNVFHWHLTEDQGFRIQSKTYPNLTGKGSDGLFYTQEDAKEIVAYARARGIRGNNTGRCARTGNPCQCRERLPARHGPDPWRPARCTKIPQCSRVPLSVAVRTARRPA